MEVKARHWLYLMGMMTGNLLIWAALTCLLSKDDDPWGETKFAVSLFGVVGITLAGWAIGVKMEAEENEKKEK